MTPEFKKLPMPPPLPSPLPNQFEDLLRAGTRRINQENDQFVVVWVILGSLFFLVAAVPLIIAFAFLIGPLLSH